MLLRFLRSRSGTSAVEFALIAPILAAVIALGWNVWQAEVGYENAEGALRAGAEYYTAGGTSDTTAQSVALKAWASAPSNATLTAMRACYCGTVAISCSTTCSSGVTRNIYVTMTATGTGQGVFAGQNRTEQEVIRVQ